MVKVGKVKCAYLREQDVVYIEDLAQALDRTDSYVIARFLEKAIELHKKGEFEI